MIVHFNRNNSSECICYWITSAEHGVAELLASCHTTKEIAKKLDRAPKTIESHVERIKKKFNCKKRHELEEACRDYLMLFKKE